VFEAVPPDVYRCKCGYEYEIRAQACLINWYKDDNKQQEDYLIDPSKWVLTDVEEIIAEQSTCAKCGHEFDSAKIVYDTGEEYCLDCWVKIRTEIDIPIYPDGSERHG
jgi:DNA-directed RNA polymerase subunit M/transcription elongation factor TFIIS